MNNDNNDPIAVEPQSQHSKNPQSQQTLTSAPPLPSSLSNQDFHFFNNFETFKLSIDRIAKTSYSWNNGINLSDGWVADLNDEILERFDISMDEKEQQSGHVMESDQDNYGFQLVHGKKKKKGSSAAVVTTATTKAKVPFHIPMIRKPQEEYNILVDNSNQPFEHVWLQRSDDGLRFVHPLEKLSVMNFVDRGIAYGEPIIPALIEPTRPKLVEEVKDLKELAAKVRSVDEFAVDLEHNQYRSFQGLTCLMQISTRTEDFIVDTLKLRIHIGPYLREVFKDPMKKKVMHGADRDILWLQRDFGIYLCNLFDTGQASRVLKLERNSLEHLLQHYCGVTANKVYQNADWRLRPLPDEMLRYAREDTHYLLYIYDLMRVKLLLMPKEPERCDAPLVEVYKRSADVCMQLYEKELLMENSYLHIYGLQGAGFNAEQLAIVAALCEWRDMIARSEDESTGYVLPNKLLLEIAKQTAVTASKLCRLLKTKHPYVERNVGAVVSIIKHSLQNAVAFEAAAQQLRMERVVNASEEQVAVNEGVEALPPEIPTDSKVANDRTEIIDGGMGRPDRIKSHHDSPQHRGALLQFGSSISGLDMVKQQTRFPLEPDLSGMSMFSKESFAISGQSGEANAWPVIPPSEKIEKEDDKLEEVGSSVNLSFHLNSGTKEQPKPAMKEPTKLPEVSRPEEPPTEATESTSENIIMLEDNSNKNETINGNSSLEDETMSLSELSTGFQQCFQSINDQQRNAIKVKKSKGPNNVLQMKPFDYEAATKEVTFGTVDAGKGSGSHSNSAGKKKSSAIGRLQIDDGSKQFPQARQLVAFPASGNRSATFR